MTSKMGAYTMNKALSIMIVIGMLLMVAMPIVNAIHTDTVYVGETGKIAGYNTDDYDAQRWGDYIVWTRALDIYDSGGNVIPDGNVVSGGGLHDPSWIMVQQISTGQSWNITPDYDAGLRISPNYYYHSGSVSIYNNHVLYETIYGDDNWERTLYMYNITTNETWHIPQGLSTYTGGYEHQIFGDWIYFTHYGNGRYIYVYNYKTGEGRRIDGGATSNSYLGMNKDFMWFTDTGSSPNVLKIYGLYTGKLTQISGVNVGASIYASNKASSGGLLGVFLSASGDMDSYIIDMEGMNITDQGSDTTIYWEDIAEDNLITVDTEDSYDSYAPYTDGFNAIYSISDGTQQDIMIYDIAEDRNIPFATSSNDERLSDYHSSMILYNSNINSFTKNNNPTDDYDIYRSVSDTEYINNTIWDYAPYIIILLVIGVILGAFKLFGASAGGGMI